MKNLFLITIFVLLFESLAWSGTITAVKEKKVLIEFEEEEAVAGEQYFAINPETEKKTAILEINQVKGKKAVAIIKKGSASRGYEVRRKAAAGESGESSTSVKKVSSNKGGLLLGLSSNKMSVQISGVTTDMTGSNYGFGGFYDYNLGDSMYIHGIALYEAYKVAGSITSLLCTNSNDCTTDITYLSTYALFRYNLYEGKPLTVWAGAGFGFLYALSKASNALNTSNLSYNISTSLSVGAEWLLKNKSFIPLAIQYNLFPDTSSVKTTNSLHITAGYGWNF